VKKKHFANGQADKARPEKPSTMGRKFPKHGNAQLYNLLLLCLINQYENFSVSKTA